LPIVALLGLKPSGSPSTCVSDSPSGLAFKNPTFDPCRLLNPSRSAFRSTFDFRRRSTLWPCLRIQLPTIAVCCTFQPSHPANLRLASPINPPTVPPDSAYDSHRLLRPPAQSLDCSSTVVADQPQTMPFNSTSDLIEGCVLRLSFPAELRPSPPINSPALPLSPTSDLLRRSMLPTDRSVFHT